MSEGPPRSRAARQAAQDALVSVVRHYGTTPEFVLLGGLVPELLCAASPALHAGTTDVDVQVNLEIAAGSVNAGRLEGALVAAGFEPDGEHVWRWCAEASSVPMVVKFELLADLDTAPARTTVTFDNCERLGAVNLRGTGYASRDCSQRRLIGVIDGRAQEVTINVAGLAGFLLAKCAAAGERRKTKDWYDIAFVLINNDAGGPTGAAGAVNDAFSTDLAAATTMLDDLAANFADPKAQGPQAYADQVTLDHPDVDFATAAADAVLAIDAFLAKLNR